MILDDIPKCPYLPLAEGRASTVFSAMQEPIPDFIWYTRSSAPTGHSSSCYLRSQSFWQTDRLHTHTHRRTATFIYIDIIEFEIEPGRWSPVFWALAGILLSLCCFKHPFPDLLGAMVIPTYWVVFVSAGQTDRQTDRQTAVADSPLTPTRLP